MEENKKEELYKKFLAMEARFQLLSERDSVAPIWELVRFTMFRAVTTPERGHTRAAGLVSFCRRNILLSLLHRPKYLFFAHPRRRLESDGRFWDTYTDPVIQEIGEEKTITIERSWHGKHFRPPKTRRVYHLDSLESVARIVSKTGLFRLTSEQRSKLRAIRRFILVEFGVDVDVERQGTALYRRYLVYRAFYLIYLRVLRPRVIFLVASNVHGALIAAARSQRIPTVELQHAMISRYTVVLNYEGYRRKTQAPDFLFTFGDFWSRQADLPLPRENVISIGYPYLKMKSEQAGTARTDTVTIVSQFITGLALSSLAVAVARRWKHIDVVYKLHPEEIHNWKARYPELQSAAEEGLLSVVDSQKPHLYDLLQSSKWQIGVSSTALLEGIAFGCRTYLLDLPEVAAMEPFIRENLVTVITGPEDLDFESYSDPRVDFEDVYAGEWRARLSAAIPIVERYYSGSRP